ncbi:hypothetical protein [Siminovitchia fortis]|nr:hypothetical protein [Siminovitchia fortis]
MIDIMENENGIIEENAWKYNDWDERRYGEGDGWDEKGGCEWDWDKG